MVFGRAAVLAVAVSGAVGPLAAQENGSSSAPGRLVGRVLDVETSEPIVNAQVFIHSLDRGALSDLDGRFVIPQIPAGTHDVTVQVIGYGEKTVTGVSVTPGEMTVVNVTLAPRAVELGSITVTAERERGSSAYLMDERRTAEAVTDAVGSVDISRLPDSDAADVATRMTGLTVTEGKYVHMRGLGARYSQTSLNGSPLPSPEPEREVVPLDLFPSGFLESLTAQKTYTPDLPGDFSGGSMQIRTRDFPNFFMMKFGLGTSLNTESHFSDDFLTYPGGDLDYLGIDDGTRDLPEVVNEILGGLRGDRVPSDIDVKEQLGQGFPARFTPVTQTTPLNRSFDVSVGNRFSLLERDVGYMLAFTYSDRHTIRADEVERKYRSTAFDPSLDSATPNVDYTFDKGVHAVSWGTIANVSLLLSPTNKVGVRTTYNRNADDEARVIVGENREDLGGEVLDHRLRFVSRSLAWGQLFGEHRIGESRLEWRVTGARATRDEPMLREAVYMRAFGAADEPYFLENRGESGRYFFSDLTDDDLSTRLDWKIPFALGNRDVSVKVGGAYRERDRDFAARRFGWQFLGGVVENIDDALQQDGAIVGFANDPYEFALDDVVEPGDQYQVNDVRYAGYAMAELPLTERLRFIFGARAEQYDLGLDSRDERLGEISELEILPAANLVYALSPEMNLRAAYSRTLDRPEFRELAPFQFTEATSLRQIKGNPELDVTRIHNADLRWEWFPRPGDVVAVSGFYKYLQDPIEQVFLAAASSAYSFQNAEYGRLFGVELDVRTGLAGIGLDPFLAQANVTLIGSKVEVEEAGAFVPTNLERPLEGQSSYVVNAGLIYSPRDVSTELGLYYNVFGARIAAAGGSGVPDIYEQPRHQLDLTFKQDVLNGFRLKIKATNLLGEEHRFEQSMNGVTLLQRRYDTGRTVSFGLSYTLQ